MRVAWALGMMALVVTGCLGAPASAPAEKTFTLGTTTTTQDSGLLDVLLPAFENATSIHVKAVVGGSGEVIARAQRGDVDAILSHSRAAEIALVASGDGVARRPVMFNAFFLVGPPSDIADVSAGPNATRALTRIYENQTRVQFASRGDKSGTDVKEKSLWRSAGLNASVFDASWYKQTGAGQAQTLAYADERDAYALSDEATWAQLRANGKLTHLKVLLQGDAQALSNQYGVIVVNATKHPGVRQDLAVTFADWLVGPQGQRAIAEYRIGGAQVFYPNADDTSA